MPATRTPQPIATITPSGWTETKRPIRNGCSTWPSICCTTITPASISSAVIGPWSTSATSTATVPAMVAPTIGTKAPRKTSTPIASTKGTPRTAATIITPIASTAATITVARTNWVRLRQATRPLLSTLLAGGPRRQPDHPGPDPVAVGEEEVGREQHDEEARDDVAEGGADLADPGQHAALAGALGDRALHLAEVAVDLGVAGVERTVLQPVADLADALDDRVGEVGGARGDLLADEGEQQPHQERARRPRPRAAASLRGQPARASSRTSGRPARRAAARSRAAAR